MSRYQVNVSGSSYEVTLLERGIDAVKFSVNGKSYSVSISPLIDRTQFQVAHSGATAGYLQPSATKSAPSPTAKANEIVAPMPGVVVAVKVSLGDVVTPGQTVAVIEAMKMENNIQAHGAGKVKEILVKPTQEVGGGQVLIRLTDTKT